MPRTSKGWAVASASAGFVALLCVLSGYAAGRGCNAYAAKEGVTICEIELAAAYTDVENLEWLLEAWENEHEGDLAECKMELKEREAFWTDRLEEVREEKSGEWCWNQLKDREYELEGQKKYCTWMMKSAGHIRFRGENAIKKCDMCIQKNGIKKPKIPKDRPEDWEQDLDWYVETAKFTEAEIDKLGE